MLNNFWSANLSRNVLGASIVTILGLAWVKMPFATGKPQHELTPSLRLKELKRSVSTNVAIGA